MDQGKLNKRKDYQYLNQCSKIGQTVFAGSSLCEFFPIHELQQSYGILDIIYNRGIGGFTTDDLLESLHECILDLKPSKLFINIGTNDLSKENYSLDSLIHNYRKILTIVLEKLCPIKIYVMAYYPMNTVDDFGVPKQDKENMFRVRNNAEIIKANKAVQEMAESLHIEYIDVNQGLLNENNQLKEEYTIEGLHMRSNGYEIVFKNLIPYFGL